MLIDELIIDGSDDKMLKKLNILTKIYSDIFCYRAVTKYCENVDFSTESLSYIILLNMIWYTH